MDNQTYKIKIVLSGLEEKERTELKNFCASNPFLTQRNVHGLGGAEDVIISIIYEELKNTSFLQIIIGWLASELLTFLSKLLWKKTCVLVFNGKKYVGLKFNELKYCIHNLLTTSNAEPIDLFDITSYHIDKYNKAFGQSIVLQRESLLDEKYLQIDLTDNQIYIDKKIYVYLSSYFFGSSKLSHLYKLSHDLIRMGYVHEAAEIIDKLSVEWKRTDEKMRLFIKANPLWIINQIVIGVLHELGHHQMSSRAEEFAQKREYLHKIAGDAAEMVLSNFCDPQRTEFFRSNIVTSDDDRTFAVFFTSALPLIGEYTSSIIKDVLSDEEFVDELLADLFSFEWMIDTATLLKSNSVIAEVLASLVGNSNYIVACEILNTYSYNPVDSSTSERLALGLYNHIRNNLRAAVRDNIMLPYIEKLKKDEKAYTLYRNLVSGPFIENNCRLDIDFLKYTDKFYAVLRNGHNPASNEENRDILESQISQFDDYILNLLNDGVKNFIINH